MKEEYEIHGWECPEWDNDLALTREVLQGMAIQSVLVTFHDASYWVKECPVCGEEICMTYEVNQ